MTTRQQEYEDRTLREHLAELDDQDDERSIEEIEEDLVKAEEDRERRAGG